MGNASTTSTKQATSPSDPHVADSHDLIRVHGARVYNLTDISVELPKRRLTVFTGVSGSGTERGGGRPAEASARHTASYAAA